MKPLVTALLSMSIAWSGPACAAPEDEARALFDRYQRLSQAFDPAVADLYADDARIVNRRHYPDGQVRQLTLPAQHYKALLRQAMPLAKTRGDTSSFSELVFEEEGAGVRIRATRFSNLKKYASPYAVLVAPDESGQWLIREELSESRP